MFRHSILPFASYFPATSQGQSCAAGQGKMSLTHSFLHYQLPGWPWHSSGMRPAVLPWRIVLVWWALLEHASVILLKLAMPHIYKSKVNCTFAMSKLSNTVTAL